MSETNPTPWSTQRNGKVCPICGKQTYSQGGIHPQCAMVQADEPRRLRLAAERKAEAEEKRRRLANESEFAE